MKRTTTAGSTVLLAILASSCLSYESPDASEAAESEDAAEIDQAFSAKGSGTFTYGTRTATSAGACDRTSTGQICVVPSTKTVRWGFIANPGVSQADSDQVLLEAVATFDTLTSLLSADGWSFAKVPIQDSSMTLLVVADNDFCSGTGRSNIDGYVCHFRQMSAGSLSESLPGTYQVSLITTTHIDVGDLKAKGTNATEDANLLHHAVMHGVLADIGIGMNTIQGNNCSKRAIIPNAFCNAMRPGELCRAKSYVAGGTSFTLTTPNCQD